MFTYLHITCFFSCHLIDPWRMLDQIGSGFALNDKQKQIRSSVSGGSITSVVPGGESLGRIKSSPSAEKSFQFCQLMVMAFGGGKLVTKESIIYIHPKTRHNVPVMILRTEVSKAIHPKLRKGTSRQVESPMPLFFFLLQDEDDASATIYRYKAKVYQ